MGGRLGEVRIPNDPSSLINADFFQCLVKDVFDVAAFQGAMVFPCHEKRVLVVGMEGFSHREVIVHIDHDGFGKSNQPLLLELGLFDIKGTVIFSVMMFHGHEGL